MRQTQFASKSSAVIERIIANLRHTIGNDEVTRKIFAIRKYLTSNPCQFSRKCQFTREHRAVFESSIAYLGYRIGNLKFAIKFQATIKSISTDSL